MKIKEITEDHILFDNNKKITYYHKQDCCEHNYADFKQIDDLAGDYDFQEPLIFEQVFGGGFRFGNKGNMFFVPCYSEQNGYYSSEINIIYDGNIVIEDMYCVEMNEC